MHVGSFFITIWTGIGSLGILQLLKIEYLMKLIAKLSNQVLIFFLIVLIWNSSLMAYQNWDDHDRSNRIQQEIARSI